MPAFDAFNLARFVDAQASVYVCVLAELSAGRKRSHSIWYIVPQLRGLSRSETARHSGIASPDEAVAYLAHPILGPRRLACTALMCEIEGRTLAEIMPFPDDLKFVSSMTLFEAVAPDPAPFIAALDNFAAGRRDQQTLSLLQCSVGSR